MRIYVDTFVVGGFYDKEFDEATKALFKKVEKGEIILVVSELLDAELLPCPRTCSQSLGQVFQKTN
jgi:hypothetical protein